jgi:hypothetical protein
MSPDFEKHLLNSFIDLEEGLKNAMSKGAIDCRDSAILALQGIISFINSIPRLESQTLAFPLVRLLSALKDLENGQQVPLLTPTRFGNRPPEPGMRAVIKAYSVFATDCLMGRGEKLEDACKFVAAILSDGNIPSGKRADTPYWKTVKGWRSDRSRRSAHRQLTDTYNALSKECPYPATVPLSEIKKDLKTRLHAVVERCRRGLA